MPSRLFAPAAVVLLALAAFGPVVDGGFVYDDHAYLLENPAVTAPASALDAPLGEPVQGLWRPLTVLSWRTQWDGPETPAGRFHLVDLGLHAIASLLVLAVGLALGLSRVGATAGALLFACHPVHAETVAWITARSELLATTLVLAAWWLHLRGPVALAAAALALACLAKENALAAPALFVLADLGLGRRPRPWGRWGTLALVVVGVWAARLTLLEIPLPEHGPFRDLDLVERLPVALHVAARSFALLLWPSQLRVEYVRDEFLGPWGLTPVVLVAVVLAILALARAGARRPALLLALVPVALLPFLHLLPIGEPFAERFLYLPSAPFCLAIGGLLAALARREQARRGLGLALLLTGTLLVVGTVAARQATRPFRSDLELWAHTASVAPGLPVARYNHGVFLDEAGHFYGRDPEQPGSIDELRASLELDPEHPFAAFAHQLLARHALSQSGVGVPDPHAAARHDREALRRAPELIEPRLRLAEIALTAPAIVPRAEATELILPLLASPDLGASEAESAGTLFRQLASASSASSSAASDDEELATGTSSPDGS